MKQALIIIGILILLPFQTLAANELPLAAGLCVNKANRLIQQEKIDQAVSVLANTRQATVRLFPQYWASSIHLPISLP